MTKPPERCRYPRTYMLVEKHGLNPELILVDSITADGYDELVLDDDGDRMFDAKNRLITDHSSWPSTLSGALVVKTMEEER